MSEKAVKERYISIKDYLIEFDVTIVLPRNIIMS